MESPQLPLFYRNPLPLNMDAHADLTISPSPTGYAFAAPAQTVMLASVEFFDAGRQFPIIFTAVDGRVVPLALMGLEAGENLFVDDNGSWQGSYVPAYIRRYPFISTDAVEGQMTVCFDEAFDGFNLDEGAPLFVGGELSPKTKEIQAFLQDFLVRMEQTRQFCAMLAQAGLLKQIDAQANLNDGRQYALNGMLVVDEQKLQQLPDSDIVRLFRSGLMAMIHAHLLSLRNLAGLMDLKIKRSAR